MRTDRQVREHKQNILSGFFEGNVFKKKKKDKTARMKCPRRKTYCCFFLI
jgi:hypothetical protein